MRRYLADPERRETTRRQKREHYQANRERILTARRARLGAGPRRRRWTDEDIIAAIKELSIDGVASAPGGKSLPTLAANRFGSWAEACRAAGVISARDRPLKPDAKYSTVHARLNAKRGTPQHCEECRTSEPGRRYEWALQLDAPDTLLNEKGFPYSIRLDDYDRLCKSCHVKRDNGRRPS
jgi:hypothetical protein